MGHAREALELLLTADPQRAAALADELDRQNRQRRTTERDMFLQAQELVAALPHLPPCIVVHDPSWHPGVAGIVASRLVEHFTRPSFVLCRDGDVLSGSARAIGNFDVHAAITQAHRWIISGGGHAAAGGVRLRVENLTPFAEALTEYARQVMPDDGFAKILEIDASLTPDQLTPSLLTDLEKLAPFGMGNRRPRFLISDAVIDAPPRLVGVSGRTLQLTLRLGGRLVHAVGFRLGSFAADLRRGMSIDAVVEFRSSQDSRNHKPEFRLLDFRPASTAGYLTVASVADAGR
jgi:single-stranded-DNA-specific exonuclease